MPYSIYFLTNSTVVTACIAFHWLLHRNNLFSLDIQGEQWKITPLPVDEDEFWYIDATKYDGKLALMCMDNDSYMHTWVLESYTNWVWEEKFVIDMKDPDDDVTNSPVGFYNSEIVVLSGFQSLKYYNFKKEEIWYEIKLEGYYNPTPIFPCYIKRTKGFQWPRQTKKMPIKESLSWQPSSSTSQRSMGMERHPSDQ